MKTLTLARNIAYSLTHGGWSPALIEKKLCERLPKSVQYLSKPLSISLYQNAPNKVAPSSKNVAELLLQDKNFNKIVSYCRKHSIQPNIDFSLPEMSPIKPFKNLEIQQLPTLNAVCEWLFLEPAKLDYLADLNNVYENHEDKEVNHYRYIFHGKKTKGTRLIEAPKAALKNVQKRILNEILENIPSHNDTFGFIKGRNCLEGANRHAAEEVVICFDLKRFFPSIQTERIFGLFRCLGYPHEVARYLTSFCVTSTPLRILERVDIEDRSQYKKLHLPQGSPASPMLANLVSYNLDRRLSGLARSIGINYSRYADDITFSGDDKITGILLRVVPEIIKDEGFVLNQDKTRIMRKSSRQIVTGVVINQHLNITRKYYDQLKATIHRCNKDADTRLKDYKFRASLIGKIDWVEAINPNRGRKLRMLLSATEKK